MNSKLDALEQNKTWTIEKLPPNKKALGCKWVYRIKYKSDGTIERFKARLVILAKQCELHQMDVHNAFLHGDIEEEVFMKLPPGLHKGQPGEACKLHKSFFEHQVKTRAEELKNIFKKGAKIVSHSCKKGWHKMAHNNAQTKTNISAFRLLPHARGLGFKPRRGGFPSGAKKEWGLSPKAKVRVLHTAQLDVTGTSLQVVVENVFLSGIRMGKKFGEPIVPSVNSNEYNDTRLHEEPPSQDRG
nr:retrovirus-related Pol polyprotein from transposon TNT 1-94 [Tanacetum cinerariifolium]